MPVLIAWQHDIFDAVDGNVLTDDDGNMFFIDTIIYPSDADGYNIYRSLSPRCSKQISRDKDS